MFITIMQADNSTAVLERAQDTLQGQHDVKHIPKGIVQWRGGDADHVRPPRVAHHACLVETRQHSVDVDRGRLGATRDGLAALE